VIKFKDFKVDNTIFEKAILSKNTVLEISEDHLKAEKQCSCGLQNAIMAKLEYQTSKVMN
jgi:hypothetical protein